MSRRRIPGHHPDVAVVVGWDNPMQTFFAQVSRAARHDEEEDEILLWLGCALREVPAAEMLVPALAPFADVSPGIVQQLRADRAARLDHGPTKLQRELLRTPWSAG